MIPCSYVHHWAAPGHARRGALADRGAEQLGQRRGGALLGQELPDVEVEHDRGEPRPVLHRRAHPLRRRGAGGGPTVAATGDELVFDDAHGHRRQVEHLPAFHPHLGRVGQARPTARARAGLVPAPLVRVVDQRQRRTRMPGLPTRLTTTPSPQRLRRRLGDRRVRRRRLRRVGRFHPQPALQLGVLGLQHRNPPMKLVDLPRLLGDQGGRSPFLDQAPGTGWRAIFTALGCRPAPGPGRHPGNQMTRTRRLRDRSGVRGHPQTCRPGDCAAGPWWAASQASTARSAATLGRTVRGISNAPTSMPGPCTRGAPSTSLVRRPR